MRSTCLSLSAVVLALAGTATADFSTFDSGDEGWTASFNGDPGVTWNSAGYIEVLDAVPGPVMFNAPAAYLGNKASAFGGVLAYDFLTTDNGGAPLTGLFADVQIVGAGLTLEYNLPDPLFDVWANYEIPLTDTAGWRVSTDGGDGWLYDGGSPLANSAQILAVLNDVTAVRIGTEIVDGLGETLAVDNVVFAPIPAPATLGLLGVAGLMTRRRRG